MKVAKNVVVSIAYQVRTEDGVLVDEAPANQPLQYLPCDRFRKCLGRQIGR